MTLFSRRSLFVSALLVGTLPTATLFAADQPTEIRVDWATYNPVSILLKERGWLEKEFAKDNISIRWVQSAGSNKALEFLNAGSIDFGSTAGSAALLAKINGNPIKSIYVYSKPEWTALVTRKESDIKTVADLKGKRVAVTRGTDPHIFLVRALLGVGLGEKDIQPVLLQHPDGKTALSRGDVDAWAGTRSDDGDGGSGRRSQAVLSERRCQHLRYPQRARGLRQGPTEFGQAGLGCLRSGTKISHLSIRMRLRRALSA